MRSIEAEFAQPATPGRWLWGLAIAALLSAACLGLWAGASWRAVQAEVARLESSETTAAAERAKPATTSAALPEPPPHAASADKLFHQRQAPWPQVLLAIERTAVVGVSVTSIQFDADQNTMVIELGSRDGAGVTAWVAAVNEGAEGSGAIRFDLVRTRSGGPDGTVTAAVAVKR